MHKAPRLQGIVTAMVTPLTEQRSLDVQALTRLVEHLLSGGVHGPFVLGTTGEAPALSYEVRDALIEQTCRLVNGRVPVLVGITDTSYDQSLLIARKADACGAFGVVAAPPYYYQVSQANLLHYYTTLARELPLPLLLYNIPANSHHHLDVTTVARAAEEPNIVGLKDSGSDMAYYHRTRQALIDSPEFALLVGPEELLAEAVLLGAHDRMAAGSNVRPRLFVDLFSASMNQDFPRIRELHEHVMQFDAAIYQGDSNPLCGLKCALSLLNICGDHTASPRRPYNTQKGERVRAYLEACHLLPEASARSALA